ncbi:hypothetical protein G6F40_016454 [Rhizopus arrhizus]|nr:hypothetical protein G6F31_017075 [Rhizopus arrhizus]KAG1079093.1 hypothetical protein G6F40_016454 [Rhizopus arrhizus]
MFFCANTPGRQGFTAGTGGDAQAAVATVQCGGAGEAAAVEVVIVAEAGQHAVTGQAADAGSTAAAAEQAQRIAGGQAEGRIQRVAPKVPAGAGRLFAGRFQIQQGLDLAAALVPHRQYGTGVLALRMRARNRAKGDQQGQR